MSQPLSKIPILMVSNNLSLVCKQVPRSYVRTYTTRQLQGRVQAFGTFAVGGRRFNRLHSNQKQSQNSAMISFHFGFNANITSTTKSHMTTVGMGGSKGGGGLTDITAGPVFGDDTPRLSVRGYGEGVFQVNETLVHGSVLLLPKTYYIWENIHSFEDISIESLHVFSLIYPTLEIILIGCGDTMPGPLPIALTRYFKQKGIIIEVSNSANAAATYNVLNGEGRHVAAALLALGPQEGRDPTQR